MLTPTTFYSEFRDENNTTEKEWKEQMLALAMSNHQRLGLSSPIHHVGSDMFRTIGEMIRTKPFPPLQFVYNDLDKYPPGIYGKGYNPQDVTQVNMNLLLHITVSLPGHQVETIFSGTVVQDDEGILQIKTHRSREGYYHKIEIHRDFYNRIVVIVGMNRDNERNGRWFYGSQ
jgi:hypothetical protein